MNSIEVHYKNSFAAMKIGNFLSEYLANAAIICIGTDKCIIDSLGPLTGTLLMKENIKLDIYGTLEKPVHAMNLSEYVKNLKKKNYDCVIAIDACLGNKKGQGIIEVRKGPITPGKGIGKFLPEIGDVSIIGIVDSNDKEFNDLVQETRLSLIYEMAEIICRGVLNASARNSSESFDQASISSL